MAFKFVSVDRVLNSNDPQEATKEYAKRVADCYKQSGKYIATAESCTGGLLAKLLTDISGSSTFYECGIVSYSERIKVECLGLHESLISDFGVVSPEVAAAMAESVLRLANSNVGIGITGVAGPGPSDGKPEGEIYVALATVKGTYVLPLKTETTNAREYNRYTAALNALNLLLLNVQGELN